MPDTLFWIEQSCDADRCVTSPADNWIARQPFTLGDAAAIYAQLEMRKAALAGGDSE